MCLSDIDPDKAHAEAAQWTGMLNGLNQNLLTLTFTLK